ncbi:spore germination protein [Oceanobacillus profundus]|uniref:spore germination protein n=1 Tax=Oceanobacillus TaxID=182709 RepID=UPI0020422AAB|nr:spore germination protein [Oceanobacillus profundus]MBR3121112.1 spore germination protein [Oceanobacillus sp.]MCM3397791.1 spore germination protein [Oceanobacillus profundus]MDO6449007.1 spore germination protein [Oceanobacillus profundus]
MVSRYFFRKKEKQERKNKEENFSVKKIAKKIENNLDNLKEILDKPNDLVIREFTIKGSKHKCAIAYIDGMVDSNLVHNNIMKNVQLITGRDSLPKAESELFEEIYQEILSVTSIKKGSTLDDISNAILSGSTIFYLDGIDKVIIMDTKGWKTRSIEEPITETVIRGSREGFIENIRTNMVMIRRYIRDPNLRFKTYQVGRRSKKDLVLSYIDGIVNPDIVKEVNRRLETIDMDDAPESGYIEEWIEDSFLSPFPQVLNTERPDKVAAALLEGKVAILLDGTPFVLIAPATLGNTLQSPEDYYERWTIGTLLRALRYLAAFIAMFLPALYIALVSFHPGMIPSDLAFSIAASREGVPFPAYVEALLMALTMELLREAGTRLPTPIGQTIGIVGGLVIGEAAVSAGLVSPAMVIVVALNAIASFSLPSYSVAISFRILLFGMMLAAATFGLYGIILSYIMLNVHLVNLKSFGVPYTTPFAPNFLSDWKDLILRAPITTIKRRPTYMQPLDKKSLNKGDS